MAGLALPSVADLSLVESALAYAQAGIPVFPLAQRSKRPIYMGGFNQATTDRQQISDWWAEHSQANIGAVPGKVGCIVPDIDTVIARQAWFERVLVETASTQTGGGTGVHPWYLSPELSKRSHWRLDEHGGPFQDDRLANLLFRASGGYVVVAPSVHPDTGQPYRVTQEGVPISALPTDIEKMLLTIQAKQAGGAHAVSSTQAQAWYAEWSKPPTSIGGRAILDQRIAAIEDSPKDARNDTLLAEVGVLLNAAYAWDIDLVEAREEIRAIYVPHVADTRKSAQANREVDHAFDYVATQRYWEGPLEEAVGGVPIKPSLRLVPGKLPGPKTHEDRIEVGAQEVRANALPLGPLMRGDTIEVEYLVDDIIPRKRLTSIVAEAKVGKSLLLLDMAASLAVGWEVLGKAHGPMTVVYIDYEMTPEDVGGRLQDMGYHEDEATVLALEQNLKYWQIPMLPPLDTVEGGQMLLAALKAEGAEIVIVDTLAAAVEGAENDSDTYRAARLYSWAPLKNQGITVVRADHLGKDKSRGARGSSMKRDDVDLAWELTRSGGDDKLVLKRAYTRMIGIPEQVLIERLSLPLRHVRTGNHVWTTSAISLAQAMIKAGINPDAPGRLAERVRRAGIRFDQKNLTEAKRYIAMGMPPVGTDLTTGVQDPRATATQAPKGESDHPPTPLARGKRRVSGLEVT